MRLILPILILAFVHNTHAANVVVDSAKTWVGFMNVYTNVGGVAGAYDFGSPWGTADLSATFTNQTLLLAPNTNIDQDNPNDPFWWVGGAGGPAARIMEANFYVEDDTLAGQTVIFSGYCPSNTIEPAYTSVAFIKDFAPDYSSFVETNAALVSGQLFSIELATSAGHHIQYGFTTLGPNARLADAPSLGQVTIDPNVLVVTSTADSGPGSLRDTIAAALTGQIIVFASSLSGQIIVLTSGQITLDKDINIDASSIDGITIDGNANGRIFEFASSTTNMLTSLTLTNGYASGSSPDNYGSSIFVNSGAALTLSNATVTGNSSGTGSIHCDGTYLTIIDSSIVENNCRGIRNNNPSILTLTDSIVSDSIGSGILSYSSGMHSILRCTFSSNIANGQNGGAIHSRFFAPIVIENSTFSGNHAQFEGGAIFKIGGTLTVTSSTFADNDSGGDGGGIYNHSGSTYLNESTFSENISNSDGGGIYLKSGSLHIINSIVAENSATTNNNIRGTITSGSNNLTGGDPLLTPLGDYGGPTQTMPPLPGSPAIDAGDNTAATGVATDQRGMARVLSGGYGPAVVDIGAVEWNGWLVGQDVSGLDQAYLLPGSVYDSSTIFPGGFDPDAAGMLGLLTGSEQNALVNQGVTQGENNVTNNPASYGLYNESAFQALALDRPFLVYNAASNSFTLTIGILETPDLTGTPFTNLTGFTATSYPGVGEIDIEFTAPNSDARFYEVYANEPPPSP